MNGNVNIDLNHFLEMYESSKKSVSKNDFDALLENLNEANMLIETLQRNNKEYVDRINDLSVKLHEYEKSNRKS